MFDVILRGGEVIDGTGKKRFKNDVGIVDDRITAIEDLSSSESNLLLTHLGKLFALVLLTCILISTLKYFGMERYLLLRFME